MQGGGPIRAGAFVFVTITCLTLACGGPTRPSDQRLVVRLTVSPPTIQAVPSVDGWMAYWTVNVDAATEFPPDSHGVLLAFATGPVLVDSIQSRISSAEGQLLTQVIDSEATIRAANGGSNQLVAGGPLLQVAQQTSYATPAAPPSASNLTIVVQLRASRDARQQLITMSTVHEQSCGYRGGPPC